MKAALRNRILQRDKQCLKCHATKPPILDVHHIMPRCVGGADEEENLATLCKYCHREWHLILPLLCTKPFDETETVEAFCWIFKQWLSVPPSILLAASIILERTINKFSWKDITLVEFLNTVKSAMNDVQISRKKVCAHDP